MVYPPSLSVHAGIGSTPLCIYKQMHTENKIYICMGSWTKSVTRPQWQAWIGIFVMTKKKIWQICVCFCTLPERAVPVEAVEAVKKRNRKYQE